MGQNMEYLSQLICPSNTVAGYAWHASSPQQPVSTIGSYLSFHCRSGAVTGNLGQYMLACWDCFRDTLRKEKPVVCEYMHRHATLSRAGLDQASAVCDRKYFVDGRRLCHTSCPAFSALLILSLHPPKALGQTNMVECVMESSPLLLWPPV